MTITGFDTWGMGPTPEAAAAAGMAFRTWYASFDTSKDGPLDGPALYAEAGIWSVCNFETTVDRVITGGYPGGQADMAHAIDEYTPRGMPPGAAVILSADQAIPAEQFPAALEYYQGAHAEAGGHYLAGSYGEQALIAWLKTRGAIEIGWRSMSTAWPGGGSNEHCDLIQTGPGTIGGVAVDLDQALIPFFGQWKPGILAPGGTVILDQASLDAIVQGVHDSILNHQLGEIDLTGAQTGGTITLGAATARSRAVETELRTAIAKASTPDPAAIAAAIAAQPGFFDKLAAALAPHQPKTFTGTLD